MKNKLEKKYLTKFDYRARRLGITGLVIVMFSWLVLVPLSSSLSNKNVAISKEIEQISENIKDETAKNETILERK